MGATSLVTVPLLAHNFGAVGAAFGVLAAYTVRNVGLHLIYRKRLKLDLVRIYREGYLRVLPVLGVAAVLGAVVNTSLPSEGLGWLAGKLVVFVAVFAVLTLRFGIDRTDLHRLVRLVRTISPRSGRGSSD